MGDQTTQDLDFAVNALRDGEQAARERHQAEVELEQGLIAQEQLLEAGTGVPIVEQADMGDDAHDDGRSVITAGQGLPGTSGNAEADGAGMTNPGAGTDPSETATSHGETNAPPPEDAGVELQGDERTFEGEGRHALEDQ
ncbi:MAG: hypothetical protein JWM25_1096 [Thermoleophilia bacterium]|nr:hypothetical protein [Thermoleophilia bacterium]MCZ4496513.1 hypothetical protein [Thermoleophilia bacterium]